MLSNNNSNNSNSNKKQQQQKQNNNWRIIENYTTVLAYAIACLFQSCGGRHSWCEYDHTPCHHHSRSSQSAPGSMLVSIKPASPTHQLLPVSDSRFQGGLVPVPTAKLLCRVWVYSREHSGGIAPCSLPSGGQCGDPGDNSSSGGSSDGSWDVRHSLCLLWTEEICVRTG